VSSSERNSTTTPTQALLMLNGRWAQERAGALARRLRTAGGSDEVARISEGYRLVFGRDATPAECATGAQFLRQQAARIEAKPPEDDVMPFVADKMRFRDG